MANPAEVPDLLAVQVAAAVQPARIQARMLREGEMMAGTAIHVSLPELPPVERRRLPPARLAPLLRLADDAFIEAAYRSLLGRRPDPQGRTHYRSLLASDPTARLEVLAQLRYSAEGRVAGVRIPALRLRYLLRRLGRALSRRLGR